MQLKTVTWNIGGAKELEAGKDPFLMSSYNVDALESIAYYLKSVDPDIITLQEAQGYTSSNQVERIANIIGYEYYFYDATSDSHIDKDCTLGNGIISKFPISNHKAGFFLNPNVEAVLEGVSVKSHDKGYGSCDIHIDDITVRALTAHLLPFKRMGIDLTSDAGRDILASVEKGFTTDADKVLIQGDFNIDNEIMKPYFPDFFAKLELDEITIPESTTPKGRYYDHVLYKGLLLNSVSVDSRVLTDHYPVISTFTA